MFNRSGVFRGVSLRLSCAAWLAVVVALAACGKDDASAPKAVELSGQRIVCELSAECPEGTFCDLGVCAQQCHKELDCADDLHCTNRGRCTDAGGKDRDPDPKRQTTVTLSTDVQVLSIGPLTDTLRFSVDAQPVDGDVDYRVDTPESWLQPVQPRGRFQGRRDFEVKVDRAALANAMAGEADGVADGAVSDGVEGGVLTLRTDAGNLSFAVRVETALDGVYDGSMSYLEPSPVGAVPWRIELRQRGSDVLDLHVLAGRSPTFPQRNGNDVTVTLTPGANGGWQGRIRQVFELDALSNPYPDWEYGVAKTSRELRFDLQPAADGGVEGSFTEAWEGLLITTFEVRGRFQLERLADQVPSDFVVRADSNDESPVRASPWVEKYEGGLTPSNCYSFAVSFSDSCRTSDLKPCADALHAATRLPTVDAANVNQSTLGFSGIAAECEANLAGVFTNILKTGTDVICNAQRYRCIHWMYSHDLANASYIFDGPSFGEYRYPLVLPPQPRLLPWARGVEKVAADRLSADLLVVNESLVRAFRAPYRFQSVGDRSVENAIHKELDTVRAQVARGLRELMMPAVLQGVASSDSADVLTIRRLAQLLSRARLAAEQQSSMALRRGGDGLGAARQRAAVDLRNAWLPSMVLSAWVGTRKVPAAPELSELPRSLTAWSETFLRLWSEGDALGVPNGFVEFLYDPKDAAPENQTNFWQVLNKHLSTELAVALTDEQQAEQYIADLANKTEVLADRLEESTRELDSQLVELCGSESGNAVKPDLSRCGAGGGRIRVASSQLQEATLGVTQAYARAEELERLVDIQFERLERVYGIRKDAIEFVDGANQKLQALTRKEEQAKRRRRIGRIIMKAIKTAGSVASAILTLGATSGAAVNDLMDLTNEAMDMRVEKVEGSVRQQREKLEQAKQMKLLQADLEVEVANGEATILSLQAETETRLLEVLQGAQRMETARAELVSLVQRRDALVGNRDFWKQRLLSSTNNDVTMRVLRDQAVERAFRSRERALRAIYLAARAFEFETNTKLPDIERLLVPALRTSEIKSFSDCLRRQFLAFTSAYGVTADRQLEFSLREDVLRIRDTVRDPQTGERYTPAQQFQRRFLDPDHLAPDGTVTFRFATSLLRDNGVFSAGLCNNAISGVRVKFIGDGLGDNQAAARLVQVGTSVLRGCESFRDSNGDVVREYRLLPATALLDVGINAYRKETYDAQLFGRSVANTEWQLVVPPASVEPQNADLNLQRIEDVVIEFQHRGIALASSPVTYTPSCN